MILGAILGLAGSILPEVIKIYKDRQDKKHEIEMFRLQIEHAKEIAEIRLGESMADLDKASYSFANVSPPVYTGKWYFDLFNVLAYFYNTTVRPTIAYLIFLTYMGVKYAQIKAMMSGGADFWSALQTIWSASDEGFVSCVIMFFFGGRAMLRTMGRVR